MGTEDDTVALVLADGRRIRLAGDVVVGRAPVAPDESPGALSVSVSDPTVSKNHALIGRTSGGVVWIVDLHSSNGSEIVERSGEHWKVPAGVRSPVPRGCDLRLGTNVTVSIEWPREPLDDATVRRPPTPAPPAVAPPPGQSPMGATPPPAPPDPSPSPPPTSHVGRPDTPVPPVAPTVGVPPPPPASPDPPSSPAWAPRVAPSSPASAPQPAPGAGPPHHVRPGAPGRRPRAAVHVIGSAILLVWGVVAGWRMLDVGPDPLFDNLDGWPARFFSAPDPDTLEFADFYSVASFPGFLAPLAYVFVALVIVTALAVLIVPGRSTRWAAVLAAAIELFLLFGLLVGFAIDDFDGALLIQYDVPSLVLPALGAALLLFPARGAVRATAPPGVGDVPYARHQPHYAPGTPPFGGRQ